MTDETITKNTFDYLTFTLASQMDLQSRMQEEVNAIGAYVSELRNEIQAVMQEGAYKMLEAHGLQVQIRSKKYPKVVNSEALRAYIVSQELEADYTVTRYDETKAKRDAVKNGWPGVEVEERDELVVKAVAS